MNETFKVAGSAEVILEDKNGNIKKKINANNTISGAFRSYALYDMFQAGNLPSLLKSNSNESILQRDIPGDFIICAMKEDINIEQFTFLPPYVDETLLKFNDKVTFYGNSYDTSETNERMVPYLENCRYGYEFKELVTEYRKSAGTGLVNSICIGRSVGDVAALNSLYRVVIKDPKAPVEWNSGKYNSAQYVVEHTANGTLCYKMQSGVALASFNFKTKEYKRYGYHQFMETNLVELTNGLVIKDDLFKVKVKTANPSAYILQLRYIRDWKNNTAIEEFDIEVPNQTTIPSDNWQPVMVHNLETGNLEIFQTLSFGDQPSDKRGYAVSKVILNTKTMEYSIVNAGVFPYSIANGYNVDDVYHYATGSYIGGKYYLPCYDFMNTDSPANRSTLCDGSYQSGVICDKDLKKLDGLCYHWPAWYVYTVVEGERGAVPVPLTHPSTPYIIQSQIVSGLNLDEPVYKEENDVLRIIYHYRLA